ncbi:UPF0481 protein At3g47200-like isoform X2 [Tasmannia lanceolata]|uniref:UPF0481 protein At3g47200-like isoform X2 n=1 Tax=Tasmannia lanceolata TaxID=3420 RepID=UPI0040637FDA
MAQQSTMEETRNWVVQFNKRHQSFNDWNKDFWNKQSIYRVPPYVRNRNSKAYGPQIVSFGPYHHGKPQLMPMEEHKVRAAHHLLKISDKSTTTTDYVNALEEVVEELMESYDHLDLKWRDRNKFLELIFYDGCFLLEFLRKFTDKSYGQYAENDPIFSLYGFYTIFDAIFEDTLKIENQVPLLALNKLVAVEKRMTPEESAKYINDLVVEFLLKSPGTTFNVKHMDLGSKTCKHMLELARMCMVGDLDSSNSSSQGEGSAGLMTSIDATKLNENAGVELQPCEYNNLDGFAFNEEKGILNLPLIQIYDCTESLLLNLMAFEHLHVGTIHHVSSYVIYIGGLIQSVEDSVFVKEKDRKRERKSGRNDFVHGIPTSRESTSTALGVSVPLLQHLFFWPSQAYKPFIQLSLSTNLDESLPTCTISHGFHSPVSSYLNHHVNVLMQLCLSMEYIYHFYD